MLSLPLLPSAAQLFDAQGKPTAVMQQYWQQFATAIQTAVNAIEAIPEIQTALASLDTATAAAQAAATAANTAAAAAQSSATSANDNSKLANSYIDPASVLSATATRITIAAHTRHYADGSSVAVNGGTALATAPTDTDYVSYNDPTFAGGAVTYLVSTTNPAQVGSTHVVGAVTIPSTGSSTGGSGPSRPGQVQP